MSSRFIHLVANGRFSIFLKVKYCLFVETAILNQVLKMLPVLCSDERLKVMGGRHKDYRIM